MASVYLAEDVRHGRKVAIKVMRPELAAVIGAERFLQEIKVTANLQHPHILGLIDSGRVEGTVFYVMPYVQGESLRDRLSRERQLPVDDAVRLTREVAGALDYAHRQGVIHRDIKPENILLHEGQALVADFGIALAVNAAGSGRMTETGMSLGTPAYMSPEQAMGERSLDARTDLYALGCVLYEMLVGEPPFTGPTAQAVLAKVITEKAPSASTLRESVPRHVALAAQVALAKLPADRFPTAAAFADALVRPGVLDSQYQTAASEAALPVPPRRHWYQDRRVLVLAAVAAGAIAFALWSSLRPRPQPDEATARFEFLPRRDQTPRTLTGRNVAVSPDGSRIVFVGAAIGAQSMLYLRRLGDVAITPVAGSAGGSQPFFSPDGSWLGFYRDDAIKKVPIAGGPALTIARVHGLIRGPSWSADGTILYADQTNRLMRVGAAGGTPARVPLADTSSGYRWPELLPDGKGILASTPDHRIFAIELGTGQATQIIAEGDGPHYLTSGYLVYGHQSQAIFAVPFDVRHRQVTGQPVPVVDGVQVFAGGAVQFALSGNGVAAYRPGGSSLATLIVVDSAGRETVLPVKPAEINAPRISPDGKRVAYELIAQLGSPGDVYILDLARATSSRLTFQNGASPLWSPDGQSVAYMRFSETGNDVSRRKADGSGLEEHLFTAPGSQAPRGWAADGQLLLTHWDADSSNLDLLSLPAEPKVRPYLHEAWQIFAPSLSPDKKWVAYTSRETGKDEIYVRAFPVAAGKWQISEGGGSEAAWSADGGTLFYLADDSLVALRVQTGSGFQVLGRRWAVEWPYDRDPVRTYDVFPDGRRFVALKYPEVPAVTVVTHWFTELRERLAGAAAASPSPRP